MAGTKAGGAKAAATNKARHGEDYYREMGRKGGSAPAKRPKGFAARVDCGCDLIPGDHYVANCAGRKGGENSKRTKAKVSSEYMQMKRESDERLARRIKSDRPARRIAVKHVIDVKHLDGDGLEKLGKDPISMDDKTHLRVVPF